MLEQLASRLDTLKPGTRIVAHGYPIDAVPDKVVRLISREDGQEHAIYLWTVPFKKKPKEATK